MFIHDAEIDRNCFIFYIKGILKSRNEMELTAEELTELKLDISLLLSAADQCRIFESSRYKLISIKG